MAWLYVVTTDDYIRLMAISKSYEQISVTLFATYESWAAKVSNMPLKIVCKSCDTIILLIKQLQYLISLFENFKIKKEKMAHNFRWKGKPFF